MKETKQQVFEKWVDAYTKNLLQWANYKLNSKENAEDLVQDTFLSAFKAMDNFRNESNPRTWLFTILNNKIVDYFRSKATKREVKTGMSETIAEGLTNAMFSGDGSWDKEVSFSNWQQEDVKLLDNKAFLELFDQCIDDLPEKWRDLMVNRFILNKETEIIRQELNLTQSNYWQLIHRSKLKLKSCIDKMWKP